MHPRAHAVDDLVTAPHRAEDRLPTLDVRAERVEPPRPASRSTRSQAATYVDSDT
jgi:hypothetical protein